MTPENENFDSLRKLLALKRHEVPPPGYFNNFSARVIARIEAAQAAAAQPWWNRFFATFGARPALACAYSLAAGGLVILGIGLATPEGAPEIAGHPLDAAALVAAQPAGATQGMMLQALPVGTRPSAVDGVLPPTVAPAGLFPADGFRPAQQVNLDLLFKP